MTLLWTSGQLVTGQVSLLLADDDTLTLEVRTAELPAFAWKLDPKDVSLLIAALLHKCGRVLG